MYILSLHAYDLNLYWALHSKRKLKDIRAKKEKPA